MKLVLILLLLFSLGLCAQTPTSCAVSAVPTIVHSEGLAERLGDITLSCTGTPGAIVSGNLNVMLAVTITNRINSAGYATDATLTIGTGSTPVPSVPGLVTNQSIAFNGFQFTFPANGTASMIVDALRGDVNALGLHQSAPIQATFSGTLTLSNTTVTVAQAQIGLLATSLDSGVTCVGSPTPSTIGMTNLIAAKTAEQTTRVTEGFPTSFQPKDPTSDTGTRFLLTYSNFPAGATLYVPDAVAGIGATVPTSGGDMGIPAEVGQYAPGSQTLLLVRVLNADSTGTGGTLTPLPPPNSAGVLVLDGANPVPLTNGAGYAVYEVVAANPSATESAQIPTYVAIASVTSPATANGGVSLAPVSTVTTASTTAPIPRFAAVQPPADCTAVGDCGASYLPHLNVTASSNPLQVTVAAGGKPVSAGTIVVNGSGTAVVSWSDSIVYTNGTGWATLVAPATIGNNTLIVDVNPAGLAPGVYQAAVVINGGPLAGTQSIPLVLTVTPAPQSSAVAVNAVTDGADFHTGPVVPGELATVWGASLAGQNVTVAFNGFAASLLYTGAQQINLRIPPSLSGQTSAQMVVAVDGNSSAPFTVPLTSVAPALFTPGVLNQDNTVNSAAQPAALGSILQIFGTGMPDSGGVVTVTLQNRNNLVPLYAAAAPGLPGMQQINVEVPADLQPVASNLIICVAGPGNQQYCSQPESIALK